ncbi:MAG: hypothetical protein R3D85_10620 [Paracoccaceae bacterium]
MNSCTALGLAHPHDTGGTSTVMAGVTGAFDSYGTYDLNQGVFTIMSYNAGWFTGPAGTTPPAGGAYGELGGPMALDIAALQENYGANGNTNGGDNIYVLPSTNASGTYFSAIWDTGGRDAIRCQRQLCRHHRPARRNAGGRVGGGGWCRSSTASPAGSPLPMGSRSKTPSAPRVTIPSPATTCPTPCSAMAATLILGGGGIDRILGARATMCSTAVTAVTGSSAMPATIRSWAATSRIRSWGRPATTRSTATTETTCCAATAITISNPAGSATMSSSAAPRRDTLFGDEGNDTLRGNGGFDTVDGGDDNDFVAGGAQADLVLGGDGNDTCEGGGGFDDQRRHRRRRLDRQLQRRPLRLRRRSWRRYDQRFRGHQQRREDRPSLYQRHHLWPT